MTQTGKQISIPFEKRKLNVIKYNHITYFNNFHINQNELQ